MSETKSYHTLSEFYPYYLSEHSSRTSRRLHFIGTTIALVLLSTAIATQTWWLVAVALGGCPRTNMSVSGHQYVVLFNSLMALYIVGELVKR
jgi:hypothetical protein